MEETPAIARFPSTIYCLVKVETIKSRSNVWVLAPCPQLHDRADPDTFGHFANQVRRFSQTGNEIAGERLAYRGPNLGKERRGNRSMDNVTPYFQRFRENRQNGPNSLRWRKSGLDADPFPDLSSQLRRSDHAEVAGRFFLCPKSMRANPR